MRSDGFCESQRIQITRGGRENSYGRVADSDIPSESCSEVELGARQESPPQRHAVPGGDWVIV